MILWLIIAALIVIALSVGWSMAIWYAIAKPHNERMERHEELMRRLGRR